ncbi:MAG: Flagellar motor switch protein FliG [Phycisphaerae bacterium]|nr:Flagellar motor switch protein FliG [Phycisphaerae bacterium]
MAANKPAIEPSEELNGLRKAAILLLSLDVETSAKVMKLLPRNAVEDVTREIASMEVVEQKAANLIVNEFYNLALAQRFVEQGGMQYASALLQKSLDRDEASKILQQIEHQVNQQPFAFLQKTDSENLLTFIQDEHPQTIALVLAHIPSTKASEILVGLPPAKQIEVVSRIANMEQTNPEVIREVEEGLANRLSGVVSQTLQKVGGVEAVAEMLNLADRSTEKNILEALETEAPDLVEQIRRLMFVFEDIILVNDKGIQSILKEIDNDELALALKTASEELKDKIFRNMSERAVQLIREDMEYMGPVRISDVEAAQQRIVDIARRLEDAGEIIIAGRGGEKEIIV